MFRPTRWWGSPTGATIQQHRTHSDGQLHLSSVGRRYGNSMPALPRSPPRPTAAPAVGNDDPIHTMRKVDSLMSRAQRHHTYECADAVQLR